MRKSFVQAEVLEDIFGADSIEKVWEVLTASMAGFGFDRLIYGFTRYRTAHSLGDQQDLLILSNNDESYTTPFVQNGLFQSAPMVHWAANNVGACSWSQIAEWMTEGALSDEEKTVVEFNRKHGVTAGYTISFKDVSSRAKGAIGLIARAGMTQADADALWAEHGREITVIANTAHLKLICLPYTGNRRPLTARQREVLEWVGDGKTMQDIATIMGLTPATVEKHLRLAREALNVETTAQAVLKASYQNQIFMLEV